MTLPASWIFARSESPRLGGIENAFDSSPDARRCLGLCSPDGLKATKNVVRSYLVEPKVSDWASVLDQCHPPLRSVLSVSKPQLDRRNKFIGEGAERMNGGSFVRFAGASLIDWIGTRADKLSRIASGVACLGERHVNDRT